MLRDKSHRYTRDEILDLWTSQQVIKRTTSAYKHQIGKNSKKFSSKVTDIEKVLKTLGKGLIRLRKAKKDGDGTTREILSIKINQPGFDDHLVNDDIEHQQRQAISKQNLVCERSEQLQSRFTKPIQRIRKMMTGLNYKLEEE